MNLRKPRKSGRNTRQKSVQNVVDNFTVNLVNVLKIWKNSFNNEADISTWSDVKIKKSFSVAVSLFRYFVSIMNKAIEYTTVPYVEPIYLFHFNCYQDFEVR